VKNRARLLTTPIKIAVMGCVVNGPGEAREADIGLAGGKGVGIIFKGDKILKKVDASLLLEVFWEEVEKISREKTMTKEP
jgi:(E)-4-hydroxy-3-methylbut-2-enyl-diphosphate synthase